MGMPRSARSVVVPTSPVRGPDRRVPAETSYDVTPLDLGTRTQRHDCHAAEPDAGRGRRLSPQGPDTSEGRSAGSSDG